MRVVPSAGGKGLTSVGSTDKGRTVHRGNSPKKIGVKRLSSFRLLSQNATDWGTLTAEISHSSRAGSPRSRYSQIWLLGRDHRPLRGL